MVPGVLLFICILLFAVVDADNQITCNADCNCTGTNYTIDLSKIKFPSRVQDSDNIKFSYSITPCSPVKCPDKLSVVCQYGANENGSPHPYSCGISKNAVLVMSSFSPLKFTITYTGGEGDRSSIVNFINNNSATDAAQVHVQSGVGGHTYNFTVTANLTNVITSTGGGGGVAPGVIGIVLILLTIAAVAAYFIAGMSFMYFVRGARGVEIIPNLTLWKTAPILIKDGFVFTFRPCVQVLSKQHQEYEKI